MNKFQQFSLTAFEKRRIQGGSFEPIISQKGENEATEGDDSNGNG